MNKFDTVSPDSIILLREKLSFNITLDQLTSFVCVNMVWKTNGDMKMANLNMNRPMLNALGYSKGEMEKIGSDFFEKIMFKEDFDNEREIFEFLNAPKNKGKSFESSCRFRCKNEKQLWTAGYLSLYEPRNGNPFLQILNCSLPVAEDEKANSRILKIIYETNKRINDEKINDITPAQLKVFKHLIKGFSVTDTAAKLFLSPDTVDTHKKNLYKKLNVHTIVELVNFAYNCGLINNNLFEDLE